MECGKLFTALVFPAHASWVLGLQMFAKQWFERRLERRMAAGLEFLQ
jgi:hypothetical protein